MFLAVSLIWFLVSVVVPLIEDTTVSDGESPEEQGAWQQLEDDPCPDLARATCQRQQVPDPAAAAAGEQHEQVEVPSPSASDVGRDEICLSGGESGKADEKTNRHVGTVYHCRCLVPLGTVS